MYFLRVHKCYKGIGSQYKAGENDQDLCHPGKVMLRQIAEESEEEALKISKGQLL
jgi:hypothetical protein